MDRLVRLQNDEAPYRRVYLDQGETETCVKKGTRDAKTFAETSRPTRPSGPWRSQSKRVGLTGATPIMILLLLYNVFLIFQSIQPTIGVENFSTYKVDLQNDPAYILELLPGIGPHRAQQILIFRKEYRITSPQDLTRMNGIGQKTVDSLWHLTKSGAEE